MWYSKLEKYSMATKNFLVTYYPDPDEALVKFCQKRQKFLITKCLKPFHYDYKLCNKTSSNPLLNPKRGFFTPRAKISKYEKNFQKTWKKL